MSRTTNIHRATGFAAFLALTGLVHLARAQSPEASPAPTPAPAGGSPEAATAPSDALAVDLEVGLGADYAPRKNLEDGSRLEDVRADAGVGATLRWGGVSLDLRASHEAERVRALEGGRLGDADLDVRLGATRVGLTLASQGPTFGEFLGAELGSAAEYGADLGHSITVGGHAGFHWIPDPTLVLGLGVHVSSQLSGGPQVLPLPILDWRPISAFRVTTIGRFGPGGSLEVVVAPHDVVEISLGATYESRQHRLDEGGLAPEGTLEDEGLPVWVGVAVSPAPWLRLDGHVGTTFAGALTVTDPRDEEVFGASYDPSLAVGLGLTLRFDDVGGAASQEGSAR